MRTCNRESDPRHANRVDIGRVAVRGRRLIAGPFQPLKERFVFIP